MKVKTKNWGPQFGDLSRLMGLRSAATQDNERKLKEEVATHGGHAYGRHGAQTGWEAQFIRAVTQVTPDQTFDPMGLNPTTRRWNSVMSMSDNDGAAVFDLFADHGNAPIAYTTAAGDKSGGFLTPEAQFLARRRGEAKLGELSGSNHYAAHFRFKNENRFVRFPLNSAHIVIDSPDKGAPYGLGFARREGKKYAHISREFVVACIDGFFNRKTWSQIIPPNKVTQTTQKFNVIVLNKNKQAFSSMTDLCEFFELDVLWQNTCSLIFRRDHLAAAHAHGPWRLITMFPNGLEPGWSPGLFLTDAHKIALKNAGMNKNKDDYHWTGRVSSSDGRQKRSYPVPSWEG